MQFEILMRSCDKRKFIESSINFFINELNLAKSTWKLVVILCPRDREYEKIKDTLYVPESGLMAMTLNSRSGYEKLLTTIAHEMVHVKQHATGKLKFVKIEDKVAGIWNGIAIHPKTHYYDLPWEIQAYKSERILANKFTRLLQSKLKNYE